MKLFFIIIGISGFLSVLIAWLEHNPCPRCGKRMSPEEHGHNQKYSHCYNCGWCEYDNKFNRS